MLSLQDCRYSGTIIPLVLSGPARPNRKTTVYYAILDTFLLTICETTLFRIGAVLLRFFSTLRGSKYVVIHIYIYTVKLSSFKDGDVANLQKRNIYTIILDIHLHEEIQFN